MSLTLEEKRSLFNIAKTVVQAVVNGEPVPDFDIQSGTLTEDRGAFVTLKMAGELRGCIGYVIPVLPLYKTVIEVAEAAATRDWRFSPVQPDELSELHYEISALSVPKTIQSVDDIIVGTHGLIIEKGMQKGLLLPQVAPEWGWDRTQFLEHTCQKAGLPPDAWQKKDCRIQTFVAEVFGEEDI